MERNALISGLRLEFRRSLEPRPDWSPWGFYIKVSDEHSREDHFIGKTPSNHTPPSNRVLPTRAKSQQSYGAIQQND